MTDLVREDGLAALGLFKQHLFFPSPSLLRLGGLPQSLLFL